MKLSRGHKLTDEGHQAVSVLNGLLRTIGLPNTEPLRAYAALRRSGVSAGQIFSDNPAVEEAISDWLTDPGGARQWIAQAQQAMHRKANGKPPAQAHGLTEAAPRASGTAQTVVIVETIEEPFGY